MTNRAGQAAVTEAPSKPEPAAFTLTVIIPGIVPDVTIYGPFDTEDAASEFGRLCDPMIQFSDGDPSPVPYSIVLPVYPADTSAVAYYFPAE